MPFNPLRRKRNAGPKLQDAAKVEKKQSRVDPIERLAELKNAGLDLTIQLTLLGSPGDGNMKQQWHISQYNPLTFVQVVYDECGPGIFTINLREASGKLFSEEGSENPETHILPIGGERKKPKSREAKAAKQGTENVEMFKMIIEQQQKDKEMMMQHILTGQSGDGGLEAAFGIFEKGVNVGQQNQRGGAPVSIGGKQSAIREGLAGLGEGAARIFLPLLENRLVGTPPGAAATGLPPAADSKVIHMPQQGAPGAGFAGASSGQQSAPNPQVAISAPDQTGQGALMTPQEIGEGAINKVRAMIQLGAPSQQVASEFVDTVCLCEGAKCVNGQWEINILDPAAAFDKYATIIPEFQSDPEFAARCRQDFIKIFTEDHSEQEQPDEPEETEIDAVYDSEVAEDAAEHAERAEDDGRSLDTGSDEGTDQEGQDDR